MTDWQPKPGDPVHVEFDGVIESGMDSEGTYRIFHPDNNQPYLGVIVYVRTEHMTRLPDPEPAWWPPQPGDMGTRDGGTWTTTYRGEVRLTTPEGVLDGWLLGNALRRPVSDLLEEHPTLVIRDGKAWEQA